MRHMGRFARLALKIGSLHGLARPQLRVTISQGAECAQRLANGRVKGLRVLYAVLWQGLSDTIRSTANQLAPTTSERRGLARWPSTSSTKGLGKDATSTCSLETGG